MRIRPAVYAARVRITSLLAVVPAVNSCGDVADLLQCRFYLHKVVDVELHGIAILFPHFASNEYSLMQRTLGLFQSGLQVVCGVLRLLHGHTSGSISRRNFLFAYHVTKSFARNGKGAFPAYTVYAPFVGRYEKGRQRDRFTTLCLRVSARFRQIVYVVRGVMPPLLPFPA